MQAEAGQSLLSIVQRKECERRNGEGLFFWGVGNAPALAIRQLVQQRTSVQVIFSKMKSRPKPADVNPTQVLAWRRYVDLSGNERPLPDHVLITSKATVSAANTLRSYYALMCFADSPLKLTNDGVAFNPSSYRNVSKESAPVGPSQVTALLEPTENYDHNPRYLTNTYRVDLQARLVGSYWVRLTDPVKANPERLSLASLSSNMEELEWCEFVKAIRCPNTLPIDYGKKIFQSLSARYAR